MGVGFLLGDNIAMTVVFTSAGYHKYHVVNKSKGLVLNQLVTLTGIPTGGKLGVFSFKIDLAKWMKTGERAADYCEADRGDRNFLVKTVQAPGVFRREL